MQENTQVTILNGEISTLFPLSCRQPTKDVNHQVISRNVAPERLWANSREPIRQPLLKKLVGNSELSHKACLAFTDILYLPELYQTVPFLITLL